MDYFIEGKEQTFEKSDIRWNDFDSWHNHVFDWNTWFRKCVGTSTLYAIATAFRGVNYGSWFDIRFLWT